MEGQNLKLYLWPWGNFNWILSEKLTPLAESAEKINGKNRISQFQALSISFSDNVRGHKTDLGLAWAKTMTGEYLFHCFLVGVSPQRTSQTQSHCTEIDSATISR